MKPLPNFLLQRLQTDKTEMINTRKYATGLCRALMVGLLLQNTQLTELNYLFREFNDHLIKLRAKQPQLQRPEVLLQIFNSETFPLYTESFHKLSQFLLTNNSINTQLVELLNQNGVQTDGDNKLESQEYTISQAISLLYLLQSYISVDIQSILLIRPNTNEQRIISFNSSNLQLKNSITILLEIAGDSSRNIEYNILISKNINETQNDVPTNDLNRELHSRYMIKQIINELDQNTEQLRQAYGLTSLENNFQKEFFNKQLKAKLQNNQQQIQVKSAIGSRHQQFGGVRNDELNNNSRKRSRSPISLRSRECMRCKKVFQIDMFNIGSQISHFCNDCKNTFLKK